MRPPNRLPETAAGFWPRAVAWSVDAALLGLAVMLVCAMLPVPALAPLLVQWQALGTAMGEAVRDSVARGEDIGALSAQLLDPTGPMRTAFRTTTAMLHAALVPRLGLFVLFGAIYWPMLEAGAARATVGKRAVGLITTDARGERLSMAQALFRHFAGTLSWLTLNIGHLLAARAPEHRALHDRIADTRVQWHAQADRTVPAWGWLLLASATLLPIVLAVRASMLLSDAMQAALGL